MEQTNSNAGKGLGIAGFVVAVVAVIFSFIPCLGMWAVIPGAVAIILTAIAYSQASKEGANKNLIIAGLIIGITATLLGGYQFYKWTQVGSAFKEVIEHNEDFQDAMKELGEELEGDVEEMEDELEELEGSGEVGDLQKLEKILSEMESAEEISDEQIDEIVDNYDEFMEEYIELAKDMKAGKLTAITKYSKLSIKAATLATRMAAVAHKLTPEQQERLNALEDKYKEDLEELQ